MLKPCILTEGATVTEVGLYARISEDPLETRAGIERQREDCAAIARLRGWTIGQEYVDNDRSAYKRKVVREQFEQMLVDLRGGLIHGIVAWDLDRFVRQPRDLERAIDIYDERPGLVFATAQGDLNLQSTDGRTMARVMAAFANKSSADTGRRVKRAHLEIAKTGRPVGGFRPFGWQADRATLDPVESALVRRAVEDILNGRAVRSVVAEWTSAGVTTTTGKEWQRQTLRQYLTNPRLAGWRTHNREILVLEETGEMVRGLWEPMLDEETWGRLCVTLRQAPDSRLRKPRRDARHYLLTGMVRCGVCGGLMYGNRYASGRHYYVCQGSPNNKHVVGISGIGTDELIRDAALDRLQTVEMEQLKSEWPGEAELAASQEKIAGLMKSFMAGEVSAAIVFPRAQVLEARMADMRKARTEWLESTTGPGLSPMTLEEWEALADTGRQRHILEQLIDAVLVKPATQRGNRYDSSRVDVAWRHLT